MNKEKKRILDKVAKIMNKAFNPAVGNAEREIFLDKAGKILARLGLSIDDMVEIKDALTEDCYEDTYSGQGSFDGWKKVLAQNIASVFFCEAIPIRISIDRWQLLFIGNQADTETCKYFYKYLEEKVTQKTDEYYPLGKDDENRQTFSMTMVHYIIINLQLMYLEMRKHVSAHSRSLIIIRQNRATKHVQDKYGLNKTNEILDLSSRKAFMKGRKEGKRTSVVRQMKNENNSYRVEG